MKTWERIFVLCALTVFGFFVLLPVVDWWSCTFGDDSILHHRHEPEAVQPAPELEPALDLKKGLVR